VYWYWVFVGVELMGKDTEVFVCVGFGKGCEFGEICMGIG
jgi:hypothetical protein